MRSNIRVFAERKYLSGGVTNIDNILPYEEFEICRDIKNKTIDSDFGNAMVEKAEAALAEEIPMLTLSLYRELSQTGIRSHFEKLHHGRRNMAFHLIFAEAYERQGRFTAKLADVLWAIMEETTWVIPAHTKTSPNVPRTSTPEVYKEETIPGLDLYAANCCAVVSLAKHLLKDELDAISPYICDRIDHLVYLRGIRPFMVADMGWMGRDGRALDNWLTNITSNILFSMAITVTDRNIRKRVVERAFEFLDNYTAYYPEDGYCDEGPGYWGGAGGNLFDCLEMLYDISGGKINVYDHPLIRKMGEYIAKFNIDGNYYLNFADARPRLEHDGKLIMRFGEKCKSEELLRFGRTVAAGNPPNRRYFFGIAYRTLKSAYVPEVKTADKTKAECAVWYESGKIAIFRECEDTSRGMFVATKGGHNAEMHNHNDVGCLVVYYNGKPVIVDPSHGSYDNEFFGRKRYERWFMKSSYHSVPTYNGIEELNGAEHASRNEVCDVENKCVTMDLSGAFPADSGLRLMERRVELAGSVVKVTDKVEADAEGDIQFNYLTLDEPQVISDGKLLISEGRTLEYDLRLELVIEKVENTYLPYDDLNFERMWERECLWRVTLRARAASAVSKIKIY